MKNVYKIKRWPRIKAVLKILKRGGSITDACKGAGIALSTLWEWRHNDSRLDAMVQRKLDSRIQIVEDALFKNAVINQNVAAQIFYLKNKGQWRDDPMFINQFNNFNKQNLSDAELIKQCIEKGIKLPPAIEQRVREFGVDKLHEIF